MSNNEKGTESGIFRIINFSCPSCLSNLNRSLSKMYGVERVGINYIIDKVYVDYDPKRVTHEQIERAIKRTGYKII